MKSETEIEANPINAVTNRLICSLIWKLHWYTISPILRKAQGVGYRAGE